MGIHIDSEIMHSFLDILDSREYTIKIGKRIHKTQLKNRANKAIKAIRRFAETENKTKMVRLEVKLNEVVWAKGIHNLPKRIRIALVRRSIVSNEQQCGLATTITCSSSSLKQGTTLVIQTKKTQTS